MGEMDGITLERLGNLHLVFLHLPIGFVVAAVLIEFWRWRRPSTEVSWLQGRLLAANAVAALFAAGAGLVLASNGNYAPDLLALHRWAGVICAGISIAVWLVNVKSSVASSRVAVSVLFVSTMVAGHFGATLTHGPGVTTFWGAAPTKTAGTTAAAAGHGANGKSGDVKDPVTVAAVTVLAEPEVVFTKDIQPILQRSCIDCHGPKKARGRLRLDSREAALAGGKSTVAAIVPGKPDASELLRRVKLPRDDDDAMPPAKDHALSASEIKALEKWIASGAAW